MSLEEALDFDLCIVGAGPAGLTLALQFLDARTRVCLVESGDLGPRPEVEALSQFENAGARRAPVEVVRARGFGGTSALWSGRCGVLDAIDYQRRSWLPYSGWPIRPADLEPFLNRAGMILGLGPALYHGIGRDLLLRGKDPAPWDPRLLQPVIWQFSRHDLHGDAPLNDFVQEGVEGAEHIGMLQHSGAPEARRLGPLAWPLLRAADNMTVLLNATAVSVDATANGAAAEGVTVASFDGRRARIRARRVVLACGGIDNARLLLVSRDACPQGLANGHGVVGRFLTDHPFWSIAAYDGSGDRSFRRQFQGLWLHGRGARPIYSAGVRLSPELQLREGLLNCAVHLAEIGDQPAPVSRLGQALRLARRRQFGREMAGEIAAALRRPADLGRGIRDRYIRRRPPLSLPDRVLIGAVAEQAPDPDSRVTLSVERDALGLPRARIDWRISDREFQTVRRMAQVLGEEMRRVGFAAPDFAPWLEDCAGAFREEIHDMAHPMGATRMSEDPTEGVVDADCRAHGVEGLYIAGSSVFPTSGHMNPTLTIVALSLRLADHLRAAL